LNYLKKKNKTQHKLKQKLRLLLYSEKEYPGWDLMNFTNPS